MSDPRYDIFFRGECLDGFDLDQVKQQVGLLFKASPEKVEQLFSGKVVALRKDLDKATALKFKQALDKAGAKIYIKAAENTASASATVSTATTAASATAAAAQSITLEALPVGSDLLSADERTIIDAKAPDTSHIKMVSTFMEPEPIAKEPPPPSPDVSHLSTAAVGSDILEGFRQEAIPVSVPDISHISLASAGEDLASIIAEMQEEVAAPDVSYISIAELGADMDPSEKFAPPPAPDVSHIKLND